MDTTLLDSLEVTNDLKLVPDIFNAVQRLHASKYGQLATASVGESPQPQLETTTSATVTWIRYRRISDQAQFQSFAHSRQGIRGGSFGITLVSAAFARTHSS